MEAGEGPTHLGKGMHRVEVAAADVAGNTSVARLRVQVNAPPLLIGARLLKERFRKGELPMEIKYENAINRIDGSANPRPLERVPGGVEFDFNITFKVFEDDPASYFETLLKAMHLLEMDALGGAGSRGCGQIKFKNITIDDEQKPNDFLESIDLN